MTYFCSKKCSDRKGSLNHLYYMDTDSSSDTEIQRLSTREKHIIFRFVAQHSDVRKNNNRIKLRYFRNLRRASLAVKVFKLP